MYKEQIWIDFLPKCEFNLRFLNVGKNRRKPPVVIRLQMPETRLDFLIWTA